ncbi:MAG: TIGR02391 family protein [Hyphomicrobiales bacterium]
MALTLNQSHLEAIATALGDTDEGLRGSEIKHLLNSAKLRDVDPSATKRIRIFNSFLEFHNRTHKNGNIAEFIRLAMQPARYLREKERFEPMRTNLNGALSFVGYAVDASGKLGKSKISKTLPEAQKRAQELKNDLISRGVHPDVLKFCKSELLADNYFHAVLEAVKSVGDKLRSRTGLTDDGAALVDRTLGIKQPMLAINSLSTDSERTEQKGFASLVKGTYSMFRNTTAHEAKIHWEMTKEDAEDLFSLVSLIHRRIDAATMPPRV